MTPSTEYHVPADPPLCVDRVGLARLLGISARSVYRLDARGAIPAAITFGNSKRWLVSAIQEWLAAGAPPRRQWTNRDTSLRSTRVETNR